MQATLKGSFVCGQPLLLLLGTLASLSPTFPQDPVKKPKPWKGQTGAVMIQEDHGDSRPKRRRFRNRDTGAIIYWKGDSPPSRSDLDAALAEQASANYQVMSRVKAQTELKLSTFQRFAVSTMGDLMSLLLSPFEWAPIKSVVIFRGNPTGGIVGILGPPAAAAAFALCIVYIRSRTRDVINWWKRKVVEIKVELSILRPRNRTLLEFGILAGISLLIAVFLHTGGLLRRAYNETAAVLLLVVALPLALMLARRWWTRHR